MHGYSSPIHRVIIATTPASTLVYFTERPLQLRFMTAGHTTRLRTARKEFHNNSTPAQRWSFFAAISLGLLMIGLDNSILFTALPTLTEELHAGETQQLWIINAYPLVLAGLLLGTGTLGDKIGHRRMFTTGLVIFGVASLAAAFSPTPAFLIGARAVLGLGAAVMMPATLALIRLTFTNEQERNTAIGIWGSVAVVGAAAGSWSLAAPCWRCGGGDPSFSSTSPSWSSP